MRRIAVVFVEWSAANMQQVVIDWTLIDGPNSAEAFADQLMRLPRAYFFGGGTAVGDALVRRGRGGTLPPPAHGPARPGDLRSNLVDARRAGELLGWKPTVALDAGLALTAEWFAAQTA